MAKEKATLTLNRERVLEVQRLTGATTTSAAIDLALGALIRAERLRQDITAYGLTPLTEAEIALAGTRPDWSDLADDTNWDAAFPRTP